MNTYRCRGPLLTPKELHDEAFEISHALMDGQDSTEHRARLVEMFKAERWDPTALVDGRPSQIDPMSASIGALGSAVLQFARGRRVPCGAGLDEVINKAMADMKPGECRSLPCPKCGNDFTIGA